MSTADILPLYYCPQCVSVVPRKQHQIPGRCSLQFLLSSANVAFIHLQHNTAACQQYDAGDNNINTHTVCFSAIYQVPEML